MTGIDPRRNIVAVPDLTPSHLNKADPHTQYRLESADHSHQSTGLQGGQLDHGLALTGLGDNDHIIYILHSLATAINDFLVASGSGVIVKKTLAETLTILGKAAASGLASLDGSTLVVENPANATATPTASKIPIADGSAKLDGWVTLPTSASAYSRTFLANAFHFPDPVSEWEPVLQGAHLPASLTAKTCWIPLNFLKIGDIITAYNLVGDAIETNALTLDCKLVRVNKANPLTTTDITNGAITQIITDGNFDVSVNPNDETVITDSQYVLQLTGTTGVGDEIYVMGVEFTITRLI